jgi:ATP-GRASP peptide maturase of grasp-with-spasm system
MQPDRQVGSCPREEAPLIAVFSTYEMEESTIHVQEWLDHLGADHVRINAETLSRLAFGFEPDGENAFITVGNRRIATSDIRSVWYRRSAKPFHPDISVLENDRIRQAMEDYMTSESKGSAACLYKLLDHAQWLSSPETVLPSKFGVLRKAQKIGLQVPPTLVTNQKRTLLDFHQRHGELIVKSITDGGVYQEGDRVYSTYTAVFEKDHIDSLEETFFPVLVQPRIAKAWEIRTFFLNGTCDSMAIFSQGNDQTREDFRRYDWENPNRTVPYLLEAEIEDKVRELMAQLQLNTGSLDFIRGTDGRTYFLEVNPVGMFGMVSFPCNMNLEKKVAAHLIAKDTP